MNILIFCVIGFFSGALLLLFLSIKKVSRRKLSIISAFILGFSIIVLGGSIFLSYLSAPSSYINNPISYTSAPRSSSPPLDSTSLEVIRRIKDNLESGNIVFNTPKKTKLQESKIIELLLSKNESIQDLQSSLKSRGRVESSRIKTSNRMSAILKGKGFEIEELNPQIQAISPDETTTWKWQVTPIKDGDQYLILTLSAIIDIEDKEAQLVIKTFEKTIKVEVSIDQHISIFIGSNWQWLWASILVPLSPFIWKYYQKRKTKNNPNNTIK